MYFEAEGKTIDDALERICEENNVKREDLEYTVVDQRKRILGFIGREVVCIKAWKKTDGNKDPLKVLGEICDLAGLDCEASSCIQENGLISVDISGEDLKIIIGKNGEVLDALQYLINKIVNRGETSPKKVILDADGYRARKITNLKRLAARSAEQVKDTGKSVVLNPMSAHDRRIIHLELKEDREVFTKSLGEGPFKKVMIGNKRVQRAPSRNRRRI
jgi:spoIIIJ-associated protein